MHLRFLLIFFCTLGFAQQPVSLHLTDKDGLPDNEIYRIIEDQKGLIYLAGNNGLTRFNGSDYFTYVNEDKRGLSLFEPAVDIKGRVWCINITGQLFYTKGDHLILFKDFKDLFAGSLPKLMIHENMLILSSEPYDVLIDLESEIVKTLTYKPHYGHINPTTINGKLLTGNTDSIFDLSTGSLSLYHDLTALEIDSEKLNSSTQLIENERRGHLLVSQLLDGTISIYNYNSKLYQPIKWNSDKFNHRVLFYKFIEDRIWMLTENGIYIATLEVDSITITDHIFPDTFITDAIVDRDGNIWVTSIENGVYIIPNLYINTIEYPEKLGKPTKLKKGFDDELLIGFTKGDVMSYNRDVKKQLVYDLPVSRNISAITVDRKRRELLFFQDEVTYIYKDNEILPDQTFKIPSVKAAVIINDKISIANTAYGSTFSYPIKEQEITPKNVATNELRRSHDCYHDSSTSTTYFAYFDELVAVHKTGKTTSISNNDYPILGRHIAAANDGGLWVQTSNDGIYLIKDQHVVQHLTVDSGLTSQRINSFDAKDGQLWISLDNAVQMYDINKESFKTLRIPDGIPTYAIKDILIDCDLIYCASSSGLFTINKFKAFKNTLTTDFYYTSVSINKKSMPLQDHYKVRHDESDIKIAYHANGLRALSSGAFEYRLLNYEDGWNKMPSGTDVIQFNRLPTGNYVLQLRSQDTKTQALIKEISLDIYEPFYKTIWFWAVLVSMFILGFGLYFRWLLRFRESEKNKQLAALERDREMINLKLENLRSQMNPHFVFNSLNSIQDYILLNQKYVASDYLAKFADLMRSYLHYSEEGEITIAEEIRTLNLYLNLEKLRFEDELDFEVMVGEKLNIDVTRIPTMLVQPYVENAIKHGLLHKKTDRKLFVKFSLESKTTIKVLIKDNGVGRKKVALIQQLQNRNRKSFATRATSERLALLNKDKAQHIGVSYHDLMDKAENSLGTEVILSIPFKI